MLSAPPGRMKRPRRDDVRRLLLDAALSEFTRDGYDRVSLDQVAAAAGFSKGAIYSNFTNKEDLFLTLMDQQVRSRIRAVESASADEDLPIDRGDLALEVGRRITELIGADGGFQLLYLEYVTRSARDPSARDALAQRRRSVRTLVANAAREALGSDHPLWERTTPQLIAIAILALSNGLALERIATPDEIPDDAFGELVELLL